MGMFTHNNVGYKGSGDDKRASWFVQWDHDGALVSESCKPKTEEEPGTITPVEEAVEVDGGPMPGKTLFFYHNPRTGGTSIRLSLNKHFPEHAVDAGYHGGRTPYKDTPEEKRRGRQFVTSHQPYGSHEFTPNDFITATVLRNPIDRVKSLFRYFETGASVDIAGGILETRNGMVRRLSGSPIDDPFVTREDLERAKENLKNIDIVGFTDEIESVSDRLGAALGFVLDVGVANVSKRDGKKEIETDSQILKNNALDVELYEWAKLNIDQDKKIVWNKPTSVGLGDTMKKLFDKLGIEQCGGCKKNQQRLNKAFPYKKKD